MDGSTEYEKLVMDYLADLDIRKSELYLSAGRVHRDASIEALEEGWMASFTAMSEQPCDEEPRDRFEAYDAEFRLRGVEPPYERARDTFDRLIAATDVAAAAMRQDEERLRAADDAFAADIAAYAAERERARRRPN